MGEDVGARVGARVGKDVGAWVGASVGKDVGARVGASVGDVGQELQVTGHCGATMDPYVASVQYAARSVHVAGAPLRVKPVSVVSTHAPAGATGAAAKRVTMAADRDAHACTQKGRKTDTSA